MTTSRGPRTPHRRAAAARLGLCVALLCASGMFACAPDDAAGTEPVTIGVILPFSSGTGTGAKQVRKALEMALAGDAARIRLLFEDDGGQPARTAELVHELVTTKHVLGIVGAMASPCALAAAARAEALEVPFITPVATNADITKERKWAFRMCFSDPQQGAHMARFAFETLGHRRVAIIRDVTNDYSVGLADAFTTAFLSLGGAIAGELSYHRAPVSSNEVVAWLEAHPCDALYLPLYRTDINETIRRTAPVWSRRRLTLLGGDSWHSSDLIDFLTREPATPREMYITAHYAGGATDPQSLEFLRLYETAFAARSGPPTSAIALGYDTGRLLAGALSPGVHTPDDLRAALVLQLRSFHGVTGSTSIDESSHELHKDTHVLHWSGDEWTLCNGGGGK
ncbi:MAG: ABC transporter substrate-binding protein [Planctomycetes bacterium]|nr:ABC transporter substrate-binding protein [Planctomycetota bacterium]